MTRYVFLDQGETRDVEPVLVGPYDTEADATAAAGTHVVFKLLDEDGWRQHRDQPNG